MPPQARSPTGRYQHICCYGKCYGQLQQLLEIPSNMSGSTEHALLYCRYAFNIIFNILNKSALNAFPCPWFIATLQLGMWTTACLPSGALSLVTAPVQEAHRSWHGCAVACGELNDSVFFGTVLQTFQPVSELVFSGCNGCPSIVFETCGQRNVEVQAPPLNPTDTIWIICVAMFTVGAGLARKQETDRAIVIYRRQGCG
jgi:hypothetical protein